MRSPDILHLIDTGWFIEISVMRSIFHMQDYHDTWLVCMGWYHQLVPVDKLFLFFFNPRLALLKSSAMDFKCLLCMFGTSSDVSRKISSISTEMFKKFLRTNYSHDS
jgi:hypothetical protein